MPLFTEKKINNWFCPMASSPTLSFPHYKISILGSSPPLSSLPQLFDAAIEKNFSLFVLMSTRT